MSSSAPSTPLLRLCKLTKKFGAITAVQSVDLEVFPGDFLTIFGPNGAGKTTLLMMIASLTRPTSGEIQFFVTGSGSNGAKKQARTRQWIGYVSHQSLLYNEMSARENLEFYARLYELTSAEANIDGSLEQMGLWEARDQLVRGFSRGMKQRLTLARALLHKPQLLLLDEPYTGLDQHASRVLTDLLRSLQGEGRTILLITHNLAEGLELCSRAIIQHRGRFVFEADRKDIDREGFQNLYFDLVGA